MWQISHTPANGASLGSFLVKNGLFPHIVPTSLLKTNGTDSFELQIVIDHQNNSLCAQHGLSLKKQI